MFTGIIKELGSVEAVEASDDGARLRIRADLTSELEPGDSVAVNGACLTATSVSGGAFGVDVMHQTLSLTTLGEVEPASRVNLELPLRRSRASRPTASPSGCGSSCLMTCSRMWSNAGRSRSRASA